LIRLLLVLSLVLPASAQEVPAANTFVAQETVVLKGRLLERGTNIPLKGVSIFVLPHKLKAQTDDQGLFEFAAVPIGDFQWVVNFSEYKRLEREGNTTRAATTLYLERESYQSFETTVVAQKDKRDVSKRKLTQAQFLNVPGAQGDPVRAVQNLPGVNRAVGFSSQVIIQGSAPEDTKYNLNGHEIPLIFHFGGLTSVVTPESIAEVEYLSAGYGPEYSRAMGGVIGLKTRSAEVTERKRKGFFFVDNLKSGGLFETKLNDKESLLISGRYSYIGVFLKRILKDQKDFSLTAAPEFADFNVVYNNELSAKDTLTINAIASRDTLGFVFTEPLKSDPSLRGNFSNSTTFYRIIPEWTRKIDADRTFKFSLGAGQDMIRVDIGSRFFDLNSKVLSLRTEYDQKMHANWRTQLGLDTNSSFAKLKLKLPNISEQGGVNNPVSSSKDRQAELTTTVHNLGAYWRNEFTTGTPLTVLPSVRLDYFSQPKQLLAAPRLTLRYTLSDSLFLKSAGGVYNQPPRPQEISDRFGNPDIRSPRALHYMIGFEKDFRGGSNKGFQWNLNLFRRDFDQLVINSAAQITRNGELVSEVYNNKGKGRSQGIESQLRYDRGAFSGWISYTYAKATRWDNLNAEYPFEFDQTHNLALVGGYDFTRNWRVSTRYRYVSGNPFTPVVGGVFDADNDVYLPVRGEFFSSRRKAFQQLDLRIDKKWIYDTQIWSLYIDIQNVLNTQNIEDVRYSYDYSTAENVMGLPLLPALGLKGEF
jgi:hypothetical protein